MLTFFFHHLDTVWGPSGDRTSLVAQLVKNLPTMQETWVQSLGWEDPLEKGKATHSSTLAWRIPLSPWGHKESDTTEGLLLSSQSTRRLVMRGNRRSIFNLTAVIFVSIPGAG